jgi:hypothetical protein
MQTKNLNRTARGVNNFDGNHALLFVEKILSKLFEAKAYLVDLSVMRG